MQAKDVFTPALCQQAIRHAFPKRVKLLAEEQPEEIRLPVLEGDDDVEILQSIDNQDAFVAYYAEDSKGANRRPEYNKELGLAMEPLKDGYTYEQLWDI